MMEASLAAGELSAPEISRPLIIATILRVRGITGIHTHFHQLSRYLENRGRPAVLVTPFSWNRILIGPTFGFRLLLRRFSGSASVLWYRHWHEAFLYRALRRHLAGVDDCVIYAQCPLAARAALRARQGPHQRVVMAVHFRISQADEWADKEEIKQDGRVYRAIRRLECDVIPRVDGLVYVSAWARDALASWFPGTLTAPSAVIHNFVAPLNGTAKQEELADLVTVGGLDLVKNHRYLFRVLAAANQAGRSFTLDVFGEGPERTNLLQLIKSLGLAEQVRLRGFRRDVRNFLPRYRAYVHASYSESSSLAIIEAMAAGLPIVAGDTGPLRELFDDGVEGRLWPLDDPAAAAEVLIRLVDSASERARSASAAKARFYRDFDAESIAPRLLSFLLQAAPAAQPDHAARDRAVHSGRQPDQHRDEVHRVGASHVEPGNQGHTTEGS